MGEENGGAENRCLVMPPKRRRKPCPTMLGLQVRYRDTQVGGGTAWMLWHVLAHVQACASSRRVMAKRRPAASNTATSVLSVGLPFGDSAR